VSVDRSDRTFEGEADWPVLSLLLEHARGFRWLAVVGAALQLLRHVPNQASPALIGYILDTVLQREPFRPAVVSQFWAPSGLEESLWLAVGLFTGLFVLAFGLQWLQGLAWGAFAYRLQHEVRSSAYDLTQRLEMGFFDSHQTGEVMSVLNNDVNEMEGFFTSTMGNAVNVVGFLLGVSTFMLLINWQFALVTLAVAPVIAVVNWWFSGVIERIHGNVRQSTGLLNAQLQNTISGIDVVKAYAAEDFESDRVASASRRNTDDVLDAVRTRAVHYPTMGFLTGAGVTATFGVGGYWVLFGPPLFFTQPLSMGNLVSFVIYARLMRWPMNDVAGIVDGYKSAKASADRIVGLGQAGTALEDPDDPAPLDDPAGAVAYDDVTFAYEAESEPVLRDVDLDVEPGETIGVVGPTGAGKSTLLKLLLRYYDPDEGTVRLDGHDLRDVDRGDLRTTIGYVGQDTFLFSGTVRENLTYGLEDVAEEDLREAAERAGALEFVEALPEGFETTIGERGVKLSGGQRQRLAIARTLLRDPAVLALDEATSHVDNEMEALIKRSLAPIVAERTTIVVAHRLSTVRDADRIVVLEDGRVQAVGSHEDLLDADGLYANLWRVQAGDVQDLPESFLDDAGRRLGDATGED